MRGKGELLEAAYAVGLMVCALSVVLNLVAAGRAVIESDASGALYPAIFGAASLVPGFIILRALSNVRSNKNQ